MSISQENNNTALKAETIPSPFDWTKGYELTDKEAEEIANPEWIIENLIISGHLIVIPAEPNAGKTTLFAHLSGEMVRKGYQVFYVNADISGGDAKPMREQAIENGFTLMLPDMKVGLSMDTVLVELRKLAELPDRVEKVIFIFDTLKKITNVINKSSMKELLNLLRVLSARGMTIILLAHTNKYTDNDGRPIYEGTGDVRSDVDELIYLIPFKNNDGSITITTVPDKKRGVFEPITFNIDKDRNVTQVEEVIDTLEANKLANEVSKDQEGIDAIASAISSGSLNQKQIIEHCTGMGERVIKRLLTTFSDDNKDISSEYHLWEKAKGEGKSYTFSLMKHS